MSILSGFLKARPYKKTSDGYIWESRDVSSQTVYFDDNDTAETKHGAINGITSDLSGEADDIAASIKCVNQLNNSLEEIKTSFQDGCEQIMAALTAKGSPPTSNSIEDIITAINNITTDVKHTVKLNGFSDGGEGVVYLYIDNVQKLNGYRISSNFNFTYIV